MKWASSASQLPDFERAFGEATQLLGERLAGAAPDWLLAFASAHHAAHLPGLGERLRAAFPGALVMGCSAHSVIGAGRELEEVPGLALVGAELPGVRLHPFHVTGDQVPELDVPEDAACILLADPWSCDAEALVRGLDARHPGAVKLGGLASGGAAPGENWLWLGEGAARAGAVGVAIHGEVEVESLVAQGCRAIGQPLFVTRADGNLLIEVDGRPPMEVLRSLYEKADAREQALLRHSLFLGLEMRPAQARYGQGDYLIRNLVGADPDSGALQVAAHVQPRQVVQFHVRDGQTAAEDLAARLAQSAARGPAPAGALLFSCLGRGRGLYGVPDHDSDALRHHFGPVPLGGFFCNGEIGPVEGRTFLHGYTSAFGLFRAPEHKPS